MLSALFPTVVVVATTAHRVETHLADGRHETFNLTRDAKTGLIDYSEMVLVDPPAQK